MEGIRNNPLVAPLLAQYQANRTVEVGGAQSLLSRGIRVILGILDRGRNPQAQEDHVIDRIEVMQLVDQASGRFGMPIPPFIRNAIGAMPEHVRYNPEAIEGTVRRSTTDRNGDGNLDVEEMRQTGRTLLTNFGSIADFGGALPALFNGPQQTATPERRVLH